MIKNRLFCKDMKVRMIPEEFTFFERSGKLDSDRTYTPEIPYFSWKDELGKTHFSADFKGQWIMIILFSLKCTHCRKLIDFLTSRSKNLPSDLIILCSGRNHKINELKRYFKDHNLPFIYMIEDPEAFIYSMFAQKGIPRIFLYDRNGHLRFQTRGFNQEEMVQLMSIIGRLN